MAEASTGFLLGGYQAIGRLLAPLAPLLLLRRAARGKEDRNRLNERKGQASSPRPAGPLVWIHAASVGETNAVLPLLGAIVERGFSVLLTTVTVTGASVAQARLPPGALHQFAPLDLSPYVSRFLAHWRPDLALFVESEIWPTTIAALRAANIPLALVNARLSPRSHRRWRRFGRQVRSLFDALALSLAQSEGDAARLADLGVADSRFMGNLKFDVPPPPADPQALAALRLAIGDRPVLLAASTHPAEEALVLAAASELRSWRADLLTVLVPRHPDRGKDVLAISAAAGLTGALRSTGASPVPATQVYIADTLGELGLFYRLAAFAFVGGSLVEHGGQNPIEPVRLGAAVIHGPHVTNFQDVYSALDGCGGARRVDNAAELASAAGEWLRRPDEVRLAAAAAAAALSPYSGAAERTLAALEPLLTVARSSPRRAAP